IRLCWYFLLACIGVYGQTPQPGAYDTKSYFPLLTGKRIGIVANHSSTIQQVHLVDTLLASGFKVSKIFCPEHGFRGQAEAGEHVSNEFDTRTGLPIISLYGRHYKPTPADLKGIDLMIFDLQDVGVRCYTYLSTLHYVMEACAENRIPLILLDRPNPNGFYIDGPVLELRYRSFVGMHPVPLVYGMTIGEYAKMVNGEGWLKKGLQCQLSVIPCKGYRHSAKVSLDIAPSPNLRSMQAIYLYPSLVLFEGTSISVGRGTASPFTCFGHPALDSGDYRFVPLKNIGMLAPPYADSVCIGFNLEHYNFPDTGSYLTLQWIILAYKHFHNKDKFFNRFFNYLAGTDRLKKQIEQGMPEAKIRQSWQNDIENFKVLRSKYLLYPD
ncbi:MAG: exo-beta-N-acetylmuramidase NamZ family protein, partial [Bacteroidales bacterium]